jgi:hypothetical protein
MPQQRPPLVFQVRVVALRPGNPHDQIVDLRLGDAEEIILA